MSRRPTAEEIVKVLGLEPHPEGGYFAETWRAEESLAAASLPSRYGSERACGTSIYFLLTTEAFSALHRLRTDEVWHHHAGDPVDLLLLGDGGGVRTVALGSDVLAGERPQVVVPAGTWQGARVRGGGDWSLCGCTMAPGFDFADFELGRRADLMRSHPAAGALLEGWTRP